MRMLLALVVLSGISGSANAGPYFRLIDPNHPYKIAGVFIDPRDTGETSVGTAVALVTHSVKDGGCLLPSLICEDWSPAVAGLSVNGGRVQFNMGPAVNLTPVAKLGLFRILTAVTKDDSLRDLKSTLSSQPIGGPDVSTSFGPALNFSPIEHGVITPVNSWHGRFVVFAGAALRF